MARVRLFHWKAQEAKPFLEALRAAGHRVAYDEKIGPGIFPKIRASPPEVFVIALTRLPSHGREVATFLRGSKSTRYVPIVFADGEPEKVAAIRRQIPDAVYTSFNHLGAAVHQALAKAPAAPVVPPQMMERYKARTAAQKLGIGKDTTVGLLDAPRDYAAVLGPMPEGVSFVEGGGRDCTVSLWFVSDGGVYQSGLARASRLAARTKLWILWRKGNKASGITQSYLRETGNAVGLVDYKICAVNARWSAMAFTRRKA